tara:strand:+ start:156233 stop:157417 length:1185 start_codon:yes stop_codon:yes gene_type:complete
MGKRFDVIRKLLKRSHSEQVANSVPVDNVQQSEKVSGVHSETAATTPVSGADSNVNENVSSSDASGAGTSAAAAIAVAAGVMATAPNPANAWINDIVKGITEKAGSAVLEPLKSIFGSLMEGIGVSNLFGTQEGAKAQGRSTDAINEVTAGVEESKVKREAEPPPHLCLAIAEAKHSMKVSVGSKERLNRNMANWVGNVVKMNTAGPLSKGVIKNLKEQQSATKDQKGLFEAMNMTPAAIEASDTINDEQVRKSADNYVSVMVDPVIDMIGSPNLNVNAAQAPGEMSKVARIGRVSLARSVLMKGIEERTPTKSGEASLHESRKLMAERTFGGGSDWHTEVLLKGSPTPLLKDMLVMQGAQNKLMLEMLEEAKSSNQLLAATLLENVEGSIRRG